MKLNIHTKKLLVYSKIKFLHKVLRTQISIHIFFSSGQRKRRKKRKKRRNTNPTVSTTRHQRNVANIMKEKKMNEFVPLVARIKEAIVKTKNTNEIRAVLIEKLLDTNIQMTIEILKIGVVVVVTNIRITIGMDVTKRKLLQETIETEGNVNMSMMIIK